VDHEFPFDAGWALKENMKLAGNLRVEDRYSPEDMHASLEELAEKGELDFEKIPTVKTIKAWIERYSANFKKEASERALSGNNDNHIAVVNGS
ncbi:10522_t:CDS:2, partial [Racocetra persica]